MNPWKLLQRLAEIMDRGLSILLRDRNWDGFITLEEILKNFLDTLRRDA